MDQENKQTINSPIESVHQLKIHHCLSPLPQDSKFPKVELTPQKIHAFFFFAQTNKQTNKTFQKCSAGVVSLYILLFYANLGVIIIHYQNPAISA